jgi:hypothetical protein
MGSVEPGFILSLVDLESDSGQRASFILISLKFWKFLELSADLRELNCVYFLE